MGDKPFISKGRIAATRGAAILGLSSWSTPFKVWQTIMEKRQPGFNAKHGYAYEEFEGNASTRWGKAFEDAIIALAEQKSGTRIIAREFHAFHPEYDFIHCYLDGKYMEMPDENHLTLHEGKTAFIGVFKDKWGEPGTDKIPIEYQIQVQHQMLCTGADECIVSVLVFPKRPDEWEKDGWIARSSKLYIPGDEGNNYPDISADPIDWARTLDQMGYFHQYIVKANPELHATMLEKYKAWWTDYVLAETPPPAQGYSDIKAMLTAPVGTIVVDKNMADWFDEIKNIGAEIGATGNMAKRRDQLKALILERANTHQDQVCPIKPHYTFKICRGECGADVCLIGKHVAVKDDESANKWVFRNNQGKKLGSYSKNKNGSMVMR